MLESTLHVYVEIRIGSASDKHYISIAVGYGGPTRMDSAMLFIASASIYFPDRGKRTAVKRLYQAPNSKYSWMLLYRPNDYSINLGIEKTLVWGP